ncbi:MAG: ABC transporter ATP-binding protein [bacterium]|nr:ABC transporter ATP-binding protein [bacterium]
MANASEYLIDVEDVVVRYPVRSAGNAGKSADGTPQEKTVLHNIGLKVRKGELVSVVGPSGCGKSTLLRLILGSEQPTSGRVLVGGRPVEGPSRERGIVFQKYSLFPHLTVVENIVFGLNLEEFTIPGRLFHYVRYRRRKREFVEQAREYLERMQMAEAGDKYPHELSGGMRQRVAIGQAAIMHPEILMMDEPFGALDDATRQEMQLFLLELWEKGGMTVFFVTHDLEEALFLGTRIIVLSQYYQADEGVEGAKIVADKDVPGKHPKPNDYRYSPEFAHLLEKVRRDGLDPNARQRVEDFDLSHRDAWKPEE